MLGRSRARRNGPDRKRRRRRARDVDAFRSSGCSGSSPRGGRRTTSSSSRSFRASRRPPKAWLDASWEGHAGLLGNRRGAARERRCAGIQPRRRVRGDGRREGRRGFATLMGSPRRTGPPRGDRRRSNETWQAHLAEATAIASRCIVDPPPPAPKSSRREATRIAADPRRRGGRARTRTGPRGSSTPGGHRQLGELSLGGGALYDASTGGWAEPTGAGMLWSFKSDGSYAHASVLSSGSFSCVVNHSSSTAEAGRWPRHAHDPQKVSGNGFATPAAIHRRTSAPRP